MSLTRAMSQSMSHSNSHSMSQKSLGIVEKSTIRANFYD